MNDSDETKVEYRGTGFYVSLVFTAIVAVALLALALQNTESVQFEFLGWDLDIPLFGIILVVAFLAVVIDEMVGLVWRRARRRRLSERRELKQLRKETSATSDDDSPESSDDPLTTSPPSEEQTDN